VGCMEEAASLHQRALQTCVNIMQDHRSASAMERPTKVLAHVTAWLATRPHVQTVLTSTSRHARVVACPLLGQHKGRLHCSQGAGLRPRLNEPVHFAFGHKL